MPRFVFRVLLLTLSSILAVPLAWANASSQSSDTVYTYDAANNRISKTTNGATTNYTYNALNQLTDVFTGDSPTPYITYAYDSDGNRIQRIKGPVTTTYTYDQENRLISLNDPGLMPNEPAAYSYQYDYRTRRVLRTEGETSTRIVFSGGTSSSEHPFDISTHVVSVPNVEYVRGSDYGGGIGGILYSLRNEDVSFTHYNNRGDVTAKTDDIGNLTYQASYEAFGSRTRESGNTQDRQKANTKDEDPTRLLNEGFRYRDLETGTFVTRDPLGFIDGPNMYAYVVQNPWSRFDPDGLKFCETTFDSKNDKMKTWEQLDESVRKTITYSKDEYNKRVNGFNSGLEKLLKTPFGSAEYNYLKNHAVTFKILVGEGTSDIFGNKSRSFISASGSYTMAGKEGDSYTSISHEFLHLVQNVTDKKLQMSDDKKYLPIIRQGVYYDFEDWDSPIDGERRHGWREAQALRAQNIVDLEYELIKGSPSVIMGVTDTYPIKEDYMVGNMLYFRKLHDRGFDFYPSVHPQTKKSTIHTFKHPISPKYDFTEALKQNKKRKENK
jgi:RHS repeat-associated protein